MRWWVGFFPTCYYNENNGKVNKMFFFCRVSMAFLLMRWVWAKLSRASLCWLTLQRCGMPILSCRALIITAFLLRLKGDVLTGKKSSILHFAHLHSLENLFVWASICVSICLIAMFCKCLAYCIRRLAWSFLSGVLFEVEQYTVSRFHIFVLLKGVLSFLLVFLLVTTCVLLIPVLSRGSIVAGQHLGTIPYHFTSLNSQ